MSDPGSMLVSRIYIYKNTNSVKIKNKKMSKTLKKYFTKDTIRMANKHFRRFEDQ